MWGIGLRWLRDRKVFEDYHILHGSEETDEYRLSPIRATIERGTPLQRRLDRPVLGSRAQGVFGRASPAHDRPAKGSHATLCSREMDSNFRFRARRNQEIQVSRRSSTDLVYGTVARISAEPSGRDAREQYRADK